MTLISHLRIPDLIPYFLAILGLLLLWKFHTLQVRAGRVQAVAIWARSGIRMFIHATPRDNRACLACRAAYGLVFLPPLVASKKFSAMSTPCTNPSGCRCFLVGFYGGWPEAQALFGLLKAQSGRVQLPEDDLIALVNGRGGGGPGASADEVSGRLLEALLDEGSDPDAAILGYRYIIEHSQRERDILFVIPAFFRVSELLERVGRSVEALPIVERFLQQFDRRSGITATEPQLAMMKARQTRLIMTLKLADTNP